MLKYLILSAALAAVTVPSGCEKFKGRTENGPRASAETVAAAPATEKPEFEPFHVPTKEEYYRMLRAGYKSPRRTVTDEGHARNRNTPRERYPIAEAEGDALKVKFGEGRKYAASGRGDEPKVPSYVERDDDGTYPPREFKGHD